MPIKSILKKNVSGQRNRDPPQQDINRVVNEHEEGGSQENRFGGKQSEDFTKLLWNSMVNNEEYKLEKQDNHFHKKRGMSHICDTSYI